MLKFFFFFEVIFFPLQKEEKTTIMDNKKKYLLGVRVNAGLEKEAVQELKDIWGSGCQVVEGEERKEKGEGGGEKAGEEGCGFVLFWTSELEKVNLIRLVVYVPVFFLFLSSLFIFFLSFFSCLKSSLFFSEGACVSFMC